MGKIDTANALLSVVIKGLEGRGLLDSKGTRVYPLCRACRLSRVKPYTDGVDTGYLCPKCKARTRMPRRKEIEFSCACGRKMGNLWLEEGRKEPKRICGWCYERRRAQNLKPNPHVEVRREIFCLCGCEKLLGWTDFKETVHPMEVEWRSQYFYEPCAQAGRKAKVYRVRGTLHPLAAMSYLPVTVNNIGGSTTNVSPVLLQIIGGGGTRWAYGGGIDSAATFAANTRLASNANVKNYTNLTINNGVILTFTPGDIFCSISVQLTLTMGTTARISGDTGDGGGLANNNGTFKGGTGGLGGNQTGTVMVFARNVAWQASSRIGGGQDGQPGGNGQASNATTGNSTSSTGTSPTVSGRIFSNAVGSVNGAGGGAGSPTGGTGATQNITGGILEQTARDFHRLLYGHAKVTPNAGWDTSACTALSGGGGQQGADNGSGAGQKARGGAGGGGAAWGIANGGNGGNSVDPGGYVSGAGSTGGGAGGGGGSGCLTVFVFDTMTGAGSADANGGTGGAGGNANGASGTSPASGGSGGGGGGGGVLVAYGPSAAPGTYTANGGGGGVHGTGTGATAGADGSAGATGLPHACLQ